MNPVPDWIVKYWVQWLFGLIIAGLTAYCRHLSRVIKHERAEQKALRDGMRSLLKRQIITDCEAAIRDGFAPAATRDSIEDMYASYHALGGNGTVTTIKNQVMSLPLMKPGGDA